MAKPFKLAFVGGGSNSAVGEVHKIAAEMDGYFELIAGCFSRDSDINYSTAEKYGISQDNVYSSLKELIANEKQNIDAIVILTPTPKHQQDVLLCIQENIPVICEKALTTSSKSAEVLHKALNKQNGFLAVTFNYTGYPMLRELRDILANGNLGKIEQIHIEMPQEGFSRLDNNNTPIVPQNWRLQDASLPTLSLDLGVHIHHLLDYISTEKPVEVVAVESNFGSFENIVDNTSCIAKYTNNIICNIWFSKTALGQRNGLKLRVFGSHGAAEWYQLNPEELLLFNNKGHRQILDRASIDSNIANQVRYNRFKAGHPSGFIEAFANHYTDIALSLQHYYYHKQQMPFEHVFGVTEAEEGLRLLEAISLSAKTNKWVNV
jgi:predicted dehydrogenase